MLSRTLRSWLTVSDLEQALSVEALEKGGNNE